jgi:hypothetical protein
VRLEGLGQLKNPMTSSGIGCRHLKIRKELFVDVCGCSQSFLSLLDTGFGVGKASYFGKDGALA